mmetsp:Transcript_12633/g.51132  ORF Transcript_12633/g.51132 Transcript_12633/m.51132 type:complete len:186 (+) Transcript_12633:65-622(+)
MAGKWFLLFTCIFGASMGCICLERPQLERLERQDWAYTVLVSRVFHGIHKVGIGQVDAYEVYIQGIQKRSIYMGRDFIGVKTFIYTPDICKANLSTGKIYTVGGNVINRQLKSFTVCDKPILLSTNEHPGALEEECRLSVLKDNHRPPISVLTFILSCTQVSTLSRALLLDARFGTMDITTTIAT